MKKTFILGSILALSLATSGQGRAQTISAVGSPFTVSASTPGPGDASDYDYLTFDGAGGGYAGTDPTNLTNFAVTQVASSYLYSSYAMATAPGGTSEFQTGTEYVGSGSGNLLTFQLTNPAETSFNVYILTDNVTSGNSVNGSDITLKSSGSASTATIDATSDGAVDEYLEFSVSGATTSDVFTVSGAPGSGGGTGVGGITFATPEPTTWALVLGGLGALMGIQTMRRRLV